MTPLRREGLPNGSSPDPETFPGRPIAPGIAEGEALVTTENISFFGGVDPENGTVVEKGHALEGRTVTGKILVFPTGKGSTVGSYTLYRLAKAGRAPAAILNAECEPIIAVGCILAGIPCVDHVPIGRISTGDRVHVDGASGRVALSRQEDKYRNGLNGSNDPPSGRNQEK